jgi:hypothetical protein
MIKTPGAERIALSEGEKEGQRALDIRIEKGSGHMAQRPKPF